MSEKRGLFGGIFGNKKSGCCDSQIVEDTEDSGESCCCEGGCCLPAGESEESKEEAIDPDLPTIKILGTGCKNCSSLEQNVKLALGQVKRKFNLVKVSNLGEIASYGVMAVPGFIVDGKVISQGKVLKPNEIASILENA